jgi:hypothetical protein
LARFRYCEESHEVLTTAENALNVSTLSRSMKTPALPMRPQRAEAIDRDGTGTQDAITENFGVRY